MTATDLLAQPVTVRAATPADAAALLQLHRAGFGSGWEMRHWRWRYVDNPLGRTEIAGAFTEAGDCLASFCGVPLPCRYGGERGRAQRAGDVVVHPRLRTSIAGALVLRRTATLFFERFGGDATRLVFGFPEPGLLRTIVRYVRCEVLGDVTFLVRDAALTTSDGVGLRGSEVAGVAMPAAAELLRACEQQVPTGIVRDAAYLRWRYEQNPHARYRFAAVHDGSGAWRGVAVLRDGGLHDEAMAITEWLVPRGDGAAQAGLLALVAQLARAAGRTSIVASFAPSSPEFLTFQAHGFRVRVSPHQFVFRSYAAGLDRERLFAEWYHSLGDLDFV